MGSFVTDVGYSQTPPRGSLSDQDFELAGTTYTVMALQIQVPSGNNTLQVSLDTDPGTLSERLALRVGSATFPLSDATTSASNNVFAFVWAGHGLSWSNNETISVGLDVHAVPTDGVELRADVSGITDTDGLDNVFYHYQWLRVDGTTVTELDGETGPTYTTTADDVTKDIQVRVIFDDDVRNREYPRYSRQITVREVPPEVTGVALTSDPNDDGRTGNDDTYAIGDSVTATVTFDKAVDVTAGPQITLLVGTAEKAADCVAATNSTTVECSYEVAAGEAAPGGVAVKANTLTLNTGTIYATGSTTNAAALAHSALAPQSGHLVDGKRPELVTTGPSAPRSSTDGMDIILTFSENIRRFDGSKITVKEDGTTTLTTSAGSVEDEVMTLTLTSALLSTSGAITVELDADAVEDLVGNGNLAQSAVTILNNIDAAPSAPTGLTAEPAPDETPQLAVDLSWSAPASDGGSAITSHQYRYNRNSGAFRELDHDREQRGERGECDLVHRHGAQRRKQRVDNVRVRGPGHQRQRQQ